MSASAKGRKPATFTLQDPDVRLENPAPDDLAVRDIARSADQFGVPAVIAARARTAAPMVDALGHAVLVGGERPCCAGLGPCRHAAH